MNLRQKVNAINKSLIEHDSDINNVNLLRISPEDENESPPKRWFPLSRNFYVRKIYVRKQKRGKWEVARKRKVEPYSTSCLISTHYILPLCYLRD